MGSSPVVLALTMDGVLAAFTLARTDAESYTGNLVTSAALLPDELEAASPCVSTTATPVKPKTVKAADRSVSSSASAPGASKTPQVAGGGGGAWGADLLKANAAAGAQAAEAVAAEIESAKGGGSGGGASSEGSVQKFSFGVSTGAGGIWPV